MTKINTVGDLIEQLKKFPQDMPVRASIPDGREGEYFSFYEVKKDHLDNQATDGDPAEYWNEDQRLNPEDTHYKYKGKLILLS
jgi:hypothetical protein